MEAGKQQHGRALSDARSPIMSESARMVLAATVGDICEVSRVPFCALSVVDGDDASVVAVHGSRSNAAPTPGRSWLVSQIPPAHQALVTGLPVVLTSAADPRLTRDQCLALTGDSNLTSLAFLPLLGPEGGGGLMVLGDTRPRDFRDVVPRLTTLCRLSATVLEQESRLRTLSRTNDDLTLVLDADLEAQSRTTGPGQVLRVIARRLAELCHVPMVDIYAVDGDRLRTLVSWQHGNFHTDIEGATEDLSDWPLTRAAVLNGRPEVVASPADTRMSAEAWQRLKPWSIQAYLSLPLLSHGRVIGIAEALSPQPRDFAEVVRPACALCEIAAHILDKSLLLETVEQRNRTLREIVRLGARLHDTTDPTELAATVADRLIDVLQTTCCEIYKVEEGMLRCLASVDVRPGFEDPDADAPIAVEEFPSLHRAAESHELLVFESVDDPGLTDYERGLFAEWHFSSELSIPLTIGDRLVGMIDIFDEDRRDFAEHLDFARTVSQMVAGVFDNLLLLEKLAESNRELLVLAESSLEFGSSLDLDQVLRSVASRMCLAASAGCCDIYSIEGDRLSGLVSTTGGVIDETFPGTEYLLRDFAVARRAVQQGEPIAVKDIAQDQRLSDAERAEDALWNFRAVLEIPLMNSGETVGLASIFDTKPREFAHFELLRGLGQIAAQAIANARVHRMLDANAARLKLINEAGLELASSLDLTRVLTATARRLNAAASVDCCSIYMLHGDELRCEASVRDGVIDEGWVRRAHKIDDWRASRLAIESRSVVSVARADDPRLSDVERLGMTDSGRKSALIAPIIVENRVVGVAELFETERERVFAADEIATVEAICRVAGLALANAELYRDLGLRNHESELLNRIAAKAGASLETPTIADATVEELGSLVEFTEACLVLKTQEDAWDVVYATPALATENGAAFAGPLLKDLHERLVGERVVAIDLERVTGLPEPSAALDGMKSLLVIGIFFHGVLDGGLMLVAAGRDTFADADRRLLAKVGTQLALSCKNAHLFETIKMMHVSNLKALISALNARDYYAVGHAARVAAYMHLLGRELGWAPDRLEQIIEASFLHDVGRIGIADNILFKPGRLTDEEMKQLREHPTTGAEILRPMFSNDIVAAVRHHHERWDGAGYPDGLSGDAIPQLARALCVVDSYDAMSFQRPHHAALSYSDCLAELDRCRGRQFDPRIVTAFMQVLDRLDERRTTARAAAEAAAVRVDPAALVALSTFGDEDRREHGEMAAQLRSVRDAHPDVCFLTTMAPGRSGWQFVCDAEEAEARRSHLGDPVDRWTAGTDVAGLDARANVLRLDDSGVWVSATAEVLNERGESVGLACADVLPAEDWPAEFGAGLAQQDHALSAIVESATARLGRAQVDAVTDGLTGLYNQRYFKQRLGEEVARATEQGRPLTLLFCDLDDFKGYNDRLGHSAGDRALRAVANVLLRSIRQVDLAARYGGEELTVILIDTTPDDAREVAERIRLGVAALDFGGADRTLTVSIGLAAFPADAKVVEELIDKADWAMYLAKRQGRNRVQEFQPEASDRTENTPSP